MTKQIITENQRGLLYKRGKLVGFLQPGRYTLFADSEVEVFNVSYAFVPNNCTFETLRLSKLTKNRIAVVSVPENHIALHYVGGVFREALPYGRYAFVKGMGHNMRLIDMTDPCFDEDALKLVSKLPTNLYTKIYVTEFQCAQLYYDNKFMGLLKPGLYYYWKGNTEVRCVWLDTRLTQLTLTGQELLTSDKITVRVSLVCSCRIKNFERVTEVEDWREQLHTAAQLALRDYIGTRTLDAILSNKAAMNNFISNTLTAKGRELFLEVKDAGVRDIILPGEIRSIMNTVLVAEKQAQANVITRREEVASTRSLLNTAKLMDENQTLYRLKELEYLSKIFEQVDKLDISTDSPMLKKLTEALK